MLDIAFSELIVIGVVALVVIGPEKLPKVARTAGILLGRAQRYVSDIKSDINRQIQFEELKALQAQIAEQARSMENTVKKEMLETEAALTQSATDLKATMEQAGQELDAMVTHASQSTPQAISAPAIPEEAATTALAEPQDELYRGEPPYTPPKPSTPA